MRHLEGKWIDESFLKYPVIRENTDVYYKDENDNEILLLKFRKNCISNTLVKIGWDSYKNLAKPRKIDQNLSKSLKVEKPYVFRTHRM